MTQTIDPTIAGKGGGRRGFRRWAAAESIEDYSLRYAPTTFRKWTPLVVASTALGGIAYLADYAIGASIVLTNGAPSGLVGILLAAVTIFVTGVPISYYSAKYAIDMDLLTRGAGFGYFGSTLTSLIYASFTFIFFALEGAIMAQAFELGLGIPLPIGYLVTALMVIPIVIYGMKALTKLQAWTQPFWLLIFAAPLIALAVQQPEAYGRFLAFAGPDGASGVSLLGVGLAAGVALSLIAQIGEQVDYLRFMPPRTPANRFQWWAAVLSAGPGWVILGAIKQISGGLLAVWILDRVGEAAALEPIQQFTAGLGLVLPGWLVIPVAVLFVVVSQIKINVTNAYAGSLAWSNFFSRVLHAHPGRVVWIFLNVGVALALMELGVFDFLNAVLGFYSNVAIAWIGAVVADLVINKPILKLSPSYVEFKRAHLRSVNPVGFGAMVIASVVSILAFFGAFGDLLAAFSPYLALVIAFVLSPVFCWLTQGRYYLARPDTLAPPLEDADGTLSTALLRCGACETEYERPDMAACPFHGGVVCSLCCSLEMQCAEMCKPAGTKADLPMPGVRF
ncbi:MAG: purine-cytosine permease family protein [Pseudonocardia sp.]